MRVSKLVKCGLNGNTGCRFNSAVARKFWMLAYSRPLTGYVHIRTVVYSRLTVLHCKCSRARASRIPFVVSDGCMLR